MTIFMIKPMNDVTEVTTTMVEGMNDMGEMIYVNMPMGLGLGLPVSRVILSFEENQLILG